MGLADDVEGILGAAPDLATAPSLALSVAQNGGDITGNAQAAAVATRYNGQDQAVQQVGQVAGSTKAVHHSLGFFGSILGGLKEVGSGALHLLNAPLQLVQHEYRYLHDVEARHGPLAALMEGLGITAGAIAGGIGGGLIAGPAGAMAGATSGASLVGRLEGAATYQDSWNRTSDGNAYLDPHTRQPVSLGRDVASVLGLKGGGFKVLSGTVDGIFDLAADPTTYLLGLGAAAKSAKGLGGILAARYGGTAAATAEDVARVWEQYPSFRRAAADIAKLSPGEVAAYYPRLANIAKPLGDAHTAEDVAQVFANAARAQELTMVDKLPTLTGTREFLVNRSRAVQAYSGPGSRAIAAVTTRLPEVFDPKTLSFSNKEFSLGDDYGANGIYRTLRMGENHDTAVAVVDAYLNTPDPGERLKIYRNAISDMLISRSKVLQAKGHILDVHPNAADPSVFADPEVQRRLRTTIDDLTQGSMPWRNGVYGIDAEGNNISALDTPGGTLMAAITDNQLGKLAFPDYTAVKRVASELAGSKHLFGNIDDFAYQHVTQNFFKRFVLLTPSFAEHVALGELIPNSFRVGIGNMIRSFAATNYAKVGRTFNPDEAPLLARFVHNILGQPAKWSPALQEDAQDALKLAQLTDGHMVTPGVTSQHHFADEVNQPVEKARRTLRNAYLQTPTKQRAGDTFGTFGVDSTRYDQNWHSWLAEVTRDEKSAGAARAYVGAIDGGADTATAKSAATGSIKGWLDAKAVEDPRHIAQFPRHQYVSPGSDLTPHEDWARVAVENMLGAVTGRNGEVNMDLLRAIATGDAASLPSAKALGALEDVAKPTLVKGRELLPDPDSALQRVANLGHQKVLSPLINFLAREPIFFAEFKRNYAPLKKAVANGAMTDDQAVMLAAQRSTANMTRFVHNLRERTQFSTTVQNFAPFYFAQEQAYKRVGRLLGDNPAAFRRYQMLLSGISDIGHQESDAQGNSYIVFPGTGWLGAHVPGILKSIGLPIIGSLPVSFVGSLKSATVIFPFSEVGQEGAGGLRPEFGPLVAIPAKAIATMFPALTPSAEAVAGPIAMGQPLWKQFVPNIFVQRALEAAGGLGGAQTRGFQSSMMNAIQLLDYRQQVAEDKWIAGGRKGPEPRIVPPSDAGPMERQQFINRVKNQTVMLYAAKAIVGLFTPLSPQLKIEDFGLPAELDAEVKKAGNFAEGVQNFLMKHPDATPWTVFQSNVPVGQVPATRAAEDWIAANRALIDKYPYAAMYLMPPTPEGFDSAVYHEQVAQGLRVRSTPQEFLQDLYVAAGNHRYFDVDKPMYDALRKQYASDPATLSRLTSAWNNYEQTVAAQNPVWWDWFTSNERKTQADAGIRQLQDMAANGLLPHSEQGQAVANLLADYSRYQQSLAVGRANGLSINTEMKTRWHVFLDGLKQQQPNLAPLINKVFSEASA